MIPQRTLRPLVIVRTDFQDLHERLTRRLGELADVVLDRRMKERRRHATAVSVERRQRERRRLLSLGARDSFRTRGYSFVYPAAELEQVEVNAYSPAFCGDCERVLGFEMPRFVQPPAHLKSEVQHLLSGSGVKHVVDLEATTAAGRLLLACRIDARDFVWTVAIAPAD